MEHVLTLIAPHPGGLCSATVQAMGEALQRSGAQVAPPLWLAPAEAADLPFAALPPAQAESIARATISAATLDFIIQPAEGRRKRLLLADMDSTIVAGETLDELAAQAGLKERISAITRRAMNGELDFAAALRERVGLLAGLPLAALQRTWAEIRLMPGARELVATMRAHGAYCVLISGGFTFFTERVAAMLGFHEHHANQLIFKDGRLSGAVAEPILGRDAKRDTLLRLAAQLGLGLEATLAVGDGANDLDMLCCAGLGVAFRAKPVVAAAARARIAHADLRALLFAQGYRAEEFVAA